MGHVAQLWRQKKIKMYLRSLFRSWEVNYEFYKENTKFSELNSFYCVQWLIWSEKLHSLDLLMDYGKWGNYWFNYSENWTPQVQVMPFWTLLSLHHYYPFQHMPNVLLGQRSVVNVIMIQATPQWLWNCIVNPS